MADPVGDILRHRRCFSLSRRAASSTSRASSPPRPSWRRPHGVARRGDRAAPPHRASRGAAPGAAARRSGHRRLSFPGRTQPTDFAGLFGDKQTLASPCPQFAHLRANKIEETNTPDQALRRRPARARHLELARSAKGAPFLTDDPFEPQRSQIPAAQRVVELLNLGGVQPSRPTR